MDIRIKRITLENFKGVRAGAIDFDGQNALVEGENGTGKSTIFDAFTWLLFGKDHNGADQTNFDIKTIDPETREPIEKLDHSVEAELLVDGVAKTLKRIWRENWVKPKGETVQVMKGHVTLFFVDGVDVVTKKNYDAVIHELIDESVFKLITDPLYFIGERTPWKLRRDVLLGLVAGEVDRQAIRDKYADLLAEMNGDSMDAFRKRIAAAKKQNKAHLDENEMRIKAYTEAMPEAVDEAALKAQLSALRAEEENALKAPNERIRKADKSILDVSAREAEKSAAVRAKYDQISKLQDEQRRLLDAGIEDAHHSNLKRSRAIMDAREKVNEAEAMVRDLGSQIQRARTRQHGLQADRVQLAEALRNMGEKYTAAKTAAFTYEPTTKCHACGQDLPAATIEDAYRNAREAYLADQKKTLSEIYNKSLKIKEDIRGIDSSIEAVGDTIRDAEAKQAQWQEDYEKARQEYSALMSKPEADIDKLREEGKLEPAYVELERQIQTFRDAAATLQAAGAETDAEIAKAEKSAAMAELKLLTDEYRTKEKAIYAELYKADQRENIQKMIDEADAKVKKLADEIARLECLELEALSFIRADVDAQEEAINRLFNVARWKMFETTLDGGIVETCEVMTKGGASYGSMNDAAKIQCGMDVIRVLNDRYKASATIFVDNAESITQKHFDTPAQVIRLKVREGLDTLTITSE